MVSGMPSRPKKAPLPALNYWRELEPTMSLRPKDFATAKANYKPLSRKTSLKSKSGLKADQSRKSTLRPISKRGSEWISVRRELKRRFQWAGIITCEARLNHCWFNEALGFAHCRKRRLLRGDEIWHVALLCNPCHDEWETSGHETMYEKIHEIIEKRGLLIPPAIAQQIQSHQDCDQWDSF
jgi:hypothetical protein